MTEEIQTEQQEPKLVVSTPDAPFEPHPFLPAISCNLCGSFVQPDPEEILGAGAKHWDDHADRAGGGQNHFGISEFQQGYLDAMSRWALAHSCPAPSKKEKKTAAAAPKETA